MFSQVVSRPVATWMIAIAVAATPVLESPTRLGATILGGVMVAMLLGALTPALAGLRPGRDAPASDGTEEVTT